MLDSDNGSNTFKNKEPSYDIKLAYSSQVRKAILFIKIVYVLYFVNILARRE